MRLPTPSGTRPPRLPAVCGAACARVLDELLGARAALADDVRERVGAAPEEVGVELERVRVRDLVVPAELRHAAAEAVTARAQGRAALARARPSSSPPVPAISPERRRTEHHTAADVR